jgi:hypothetical protein
VKKQAAVLTGDIIRSTDLASEKREQLQTVLHRTFAQVSKQVSSFRAEQFRGDSFQAVIDSRPTDALRALLLIQAHLRVQDFGVRIALGLGDIGYESDSILTSDGTAFQTSGPALDDIKKRNQFLAVSGPSDSFNQEWRVHALTLSYLLERWTIAQAEAVLGQLQGFTQEETARQLHIKQPAVQQRLQATGWPLMEAILERFVTSVHADLF